MNRLIPNKMYLSFVITPIFMLVVAFTIAGCTKTRQVITLDKHVGSEQFKFLLNGSTSQKEVLDRLGEPANRYEDGRILTYLTREDLNERLHVTDTYTGDDSGFRNVYYNLVLVFRVDLVLDRHSLVRVR
jgi:hypothetical protein